MLNDYFDESRTILVTTHQVEEIEHILTDLLFIKDGRIALSATMDDVAERFNQDLAGRGSSVRFDPANLDDPELRATIEQFHPEDVPVGALRSVFASS